MATRLLTTSTVMPKHHSFPRELPGAATLEASWRDIDFQDAVEAVESLDSEKLHKLLSQRPDLVLVRRDGQTLLSKVAASNAVNIAEFLLPFSDIAAVDNQGETALSRAFSRSAGDGEVFGGKRSSVRLAQSVGVRRDDDLRDWTLLRGWREMRANCRPSVRRRLCARHENHGCVRVSGVAWPASDRESDLGMPAAGDARTDV